MTVVPYAGMFLGLVTVLEYAKDTCGEGDTNASMVRDNSQVWAAILPPGYPAIPLEALTIAS